MMVTRLLLPDFKGTILLAKYKFKCVNCTNVTRISFPNKRQRKITAYIELSDIQAMMKLKNIEKCPNILAHLPPRA